MNKSDSVTEENTATRSENTSSKADRCRIGQCDAQ